MITNVSGRRPGRRRRFGRRPWPPLIHGVSIALLLGLLPSTVAVAVAAEAAASGRPDLPSSETPIDGETASVRPRPTDPAAEEATPVPTAEWPAATTTTIPIGGGTRLLTATETDVPVRLTRPTSVARSAADQSVPETAHLEIMDRETGENAGVNGLLFTLTGTGTGDDATARVADAGAEVGVELDYAAFAQSYGGSYGARLRLVQLPACAVTTPEQPACRVRTDLASVNDTAGQTLSAAEPVSLNAQPVVLAAVADDSGETGDYQATELSASATWAVGLNSGDFTWSYDMPVPDVPGGLTPSVTVNYSSGAIDGRTSATNNQSSWVGDGFDLWPGYIERSYHSCADEGLKRSGVEVPDLCWAYDNATLSLGGTAGDLVPTGDNEWRLRSDDGTRVQRLENAERANGDNNNEYWKVTTPDGTQYFFGYNRLPGWTTGQPETESTWNVPVYGNNANEPCRAATFVTSWCQQAWRWNLDYVIDPHGNAITYFYDREMNSYGRYLEAGDDTPYARGGVIKHIDYGLRSDALFADPLARVVFETGERCLPASGISCAPEDIGDTPSAWYDTPWDLNCTAGTDCDEGRSAPTFWSRLRLVSVTTQTLDESGELAPIDTWELSHRWATADIDWTLLPTAIQRTGRSATPEIELPSTEFIYEQGANRLDAEGDGSAPFIKHRLSTITDEFGGQIDVTYSATACDAGNLPDPESNTTRCFPQYWTPSGAAEPQQEWFNKYVVTRVVASDRTGGAPDMYTDYSYHGGAAWHYDDDDGLSEPEHKTWSQWRGYGEVRVLAGGPEGMTTRTDNWFLRGMDGDRAGPAGGTRDVTVPDGEGGTITDHDAYAGFPYRTATYSAPDGVVLAKTLDIPWHHETASRTRDWGTVTANFTGVSSERTFTSLDNGAGEEWQEARTDTTYDTVAGRVVRVADLGDVSDPDDDRCATTAYADNTDDNILSLPARERSWTGSCSSEPTTAERVISDVRTAYDGLAYGAAPIRGDATTVQSIDDITDGTPGYRTSTATFDDYGRPLTTTDHAGRTTTTSYSPALGRPTRITVTTPPADSASASTAQVTSTSYDLARGLPLRSIDTNTRVTTQEYDALGRLTEVWLPNRNTTGTATYKYSYRIAEDAITAVGVTTLKGTGTKTDWTLFDGLLRPRQTQSLGPDGGRLVTDTLYDNRGLTERTYAAYYTPEAPSADLFAPDQPGAIESQIAYTYDGLGRVLTERQIHGNGDGTTTEWARATYTYGGDRVSIDPVDGGTATTTVTDVRGQTTELWQYQGNTPEGEHDVTRYEYTPRGELSRAEDPAGNEWSWTYDILGRLTETTDPDAGTTKRTYNDRDELVTTTDARGETVHHSYDDLGRETARRADSASGPLLASWTWDTLAEGQLTSSTRYDDNGAEYISRVDLYDTLYRARSTSVVIPEVEGEEELAGTYTSGTEYNADGTVQSIGYPRAGDLSGEILVPTYDDILRLTALTGTGNVTYVSDVSYSYTGKPLQYGLSGGGSALTWVTSSYEWGTQRLHDSRVDREDVTGVDRSVIYAYDDAGNVLSMADVSAAGTDNQCFTYDYLRRMTEAWTEGDAACSDAPTTETVGGIAPYWTSYAFDSVGNRTQQTEHALTAEGQDTVTTYDYPEPGDAQPHTLTAATAEGADGTYLSTYEYDAAGNTTTRQIGGDDQTLTWDAEGHVSTITGPEGTTSFLYDADGNRLLRRTADETVLYLAGTEVVLDKTDNSIEARRFYDLGGGNTAVRDNDGTVYLQLADHHGTAELSVDTSTGALTQRRTTPYGESRGDQPTSWPDERSFVGGTADPTGLIHLGARLYDPTLGRFISVDPVLDLTDPQQINGYAYSNNNPTTYSDPTGLRSTPKEREILKKKLQFKRHSITSAKRRTNSGQWISDTSRPTIGQAVNGGTNDVSPVRAIPIPVEPGSLSLRDRLLPNLPETNPNDSGPCHEGELLYCIDAIPAFHPYIGAAQLLNFAAREAGYTSIKTLEWFCEVPNSFIAGTNILMADGTMEKIEDVEVGDEVLATDPDTGETDAKTVIAEIHRTGRKSLVTLKLDTGSGHSVTITATTNHPFWNEETASWTEAGDLEVGQHLRTAEGPLARVTSIRLHQLLPATVHNLVIEDLHTYYAGLRPVLVHNCNPMDLNFKQIRERIVKHVLVNHGDTDIDGTKFDSGLTRDDLFEGLVNRLDERNATGTIDESGNHEHILFWSDAGANGEDFVRVWLTPNGELGSMWPIRWSAND
ncbi:polymorphic toxin-type HINT domain-containing protein [Streptomyces sp. RFCAC02]|uniref:polymorphic toxin-type HINT domain-containing protein n=1 Tax=Streptomyces sp. RFCAC02 TaxID=2499143 RepID=UPI001021FDEA|nr:polymorphic toxin-type HINT domain-containing protein [Streptomyces sp. RFCAC02]